MIEDRSFTVDPQLAHRRGSVEVTVRAADGRPLADTRVTVSQRKHKFLFGCIGFEFVELVELVKGQPAANGEDLEKMAELWFELFNFATLPFYWGNFEAARGAPDTQRVLKTARWFQDQGCLVKGHPLAWHTVTAEWLLGLSNAEIIDAQKARIRREVTDFKGVIDAWDVINEVVIMPIFDK